MFAFLAFPAVLQLCVLPFLPESPRYLLMERRDEEGARRGTAYMQHSASPTFYPIMHASNVYSINNDYNGTGTFPHR